MIIAKIISRKMIYLILKNRPGETTYIENSKVFHITSSLTNLQIQILEKIMIKRTRKLIFKATLLPWFSNKVPQYKIQLLIKLKETMMRKLIIKSVFRKRIQIQEIGVQKNVKPLWMTLEKIFNACAKVWMPPQL